MSFAGTFRWAQISYLWRVITIYGRIAWLNTSTGFFSECINEEKRNELGNKPLKDILNKQLFGGWPVLEGRKWDENYNVWDQILKIYYSGYSDR